MKTKTNVFRPLRVFVLPNTAAAKSLKAKASISAPPVTRALAPGLKPTKAHDLVYHGGKTIADLTFTNFYVGGKSAWSAADRKKIDQALAAAMSDVQLNNVLAQYFPHQAIESAFKPSKILPEPAPKIVSQATVEAMVRSLYEKGSLKNFPLSSTVFNFMLPRGVILNTDTGNAEAKPARGMQRKKKPLIVEDEESSEHGLGGYHGSVHLRQPNGGQVTVYYAVGVYSEIRADGTPNGIPVFDQPWKNVVGTFYHELCEARTDADVEDAIKAGSSPSAEHFIGWVSAQGEECGDFPVFEANPLSKVFKEVPLADGSGTVPIQLQYSNAVHGPEGPIAKPH